MVGNFTEIFKDQSKLQPDYIPEELVGREGKYRELVRLFKPVLEDGVSQRLLVHGPGGSGKTALAHRFGEDLERAAERRDAGLSCAYVDCRRYDTPFKVAWRLTDHLGLDLPPGGHSVTRYLDRVAKRLEKDGSRLVVFLDWLDFQVGCGDSDLLHFLTRWWEDHAEENRISIVGLSRIPDLTRRMDRAVRSTFLHNRVGLEEYDENELEDILRRRAGLAFRPGAVGENIIEMISGSSPEADGARLGISWLREAESIAAGKGKERVTPQEVWEAERLVHEKVSRRDLENLGEHKLLLVLALTNVVRAQRRDFAWQDELEKEYGEVCTRRNQDPLAYVTVTRKLRKLSDLGIIDRSMSPEDDPSKLRVPGNKAGVLGSVARSVTRGEGGRYNRTGFLYK